MAEEQAIAKEASQSLRTKKHHHVCGKSSPAKCSKKKRTEANLDKHITHGEKNKHTMVLWLRLLQ